MRSDRLRLDDILVRSRRVSEIVALGRDAIDEWLVFDALVRNIEVIGEAANRVSLETKGLAPSESWRLATAMRNRLIHAYEQADPDIVWDTAVHHVPKLAELARKALTELESD